MSLIWNNNISVSYFGEEHDPVIGVSIRGLPAGEFIDPEAMAKFMGRMSPKSWTGKPAPMPRILSGIKNDRTTGAPLCAILQNADITPKTNLAPEEITTRIGNADYTGAVRFRGFCDVKRKSFAAERFTSAMCFTGAVCAQILERRGIYTGAHIAQIHNIKDNPYDTVRISRDAVLSIRTKDFPVIHDRKGWKMLKDLEMAKEAGEGLGGIVECASVNVPSGVGSPVFDGLQNSIAQLVFGIPDISGIEFGAGFSAAEMIGSQYSDDFYTDDKGYSVTKTNSHGGVIGGITSGMPITLKAAFKPPRPETGEVCTVPRAVVCVEAAVNIALLSNMMDYPNFA